MKVRPAFFVLAALGILSLPLAAEDPNYSYRAPRAHRARMKSKISARSPHRPERESGGERRNRASGSGEIEFRFNVNARGEFTSNAKLHGDLQRR